MMGIMSDRTKAMNSKVIEGLAMGLELSGNPACVAAAAIIRAQGEKLLKAGYDYLGFTDEVTVEVDGDVTGTIQG